MSGPHRIKEIRKTALLNIGRKISGITIANKLGITPQYYYDIERGERTLSAEFAAKIADILGVSVDYLLGRTDQVSSGKPAQTDDVEDILEALHKRPEMKALFSLSKNATKKDIEKAIKIIEALKDK